jgi:ABC-2 type transport system permease protein
MNKLWVLTRTLLKNGGETFPRFKGKKGGRTKTGLFVALIMLAFFPLAIVFAGMIAKLYEALAPLGQEGFVLALGFGVVSIGVFFLGIFYVAGIFYFSRDIENLLPLPLKPSEILGAKLVVALVFEYLTGIVILLPVLISFGLKSGGGIVYYLYSGIIFFVLPIIALVPAALINMIIMGFTNLAKNKDRFRIVGGVIALFLGLGMNIFIQRFAGTATNPEELQRIILEGNNSFMGIAANIFPGSKMAASALINSGNLDGLFHLFTFLLLAIFSLVLYFFLGQFLYFKGVVGISEAPSARKRLDGERLERTVRRSSPVKSYTLKELRLLFRTPVYFLNCVVMNFLWPLFLLIPLFTQPEAFKMLLMVESFVQDSQRGGIVLAIFFALSLFVSATNSIASTTFSREGQNIFVNKYLPIDYRKQLLAKLLSAVIMGFAGILSSLIIATFLFNLPGYLLFSLIIVGFLGTVFSSLLGMLIDLNFPKLDWDNEQKAVKQNFNSIITLLLSLAVAGIAILSALKFPIGFGTMFLAIFLGCSLLNLVFYKILMTKGVELFAQIEI